MTVLNITGRTSDRAGSGLSQFTWELGKSVNIASLASNRRVSPFCLEHEQRKVVLVETRPGTNLFKVPFCYVSQAENAIRLFLIDYAEFEAMVRGLVIAPRPTTIIHSISRSGSTLVARIFDTATGMATLCEPGVFHDAAIAFRQGLASLDDLVPILHACFLFSFRHHADANHFVLKLRHSGCLIAALLRTAVGDTATEVFVYRNAIDTVESMAQRFMERERREACATVHGRQPLVARDTAWLADYRADLVQQAPVTARFSDEYLCTLGPLLPYLPLWLGNVDLYLAARRHGSAITAFRYESLLGDPVVSIRTLFDHCGITGDILKAKRALSTDSQEGSALARDPSGRRYKPILRPTDVAHLRAILRSYEPWLAPDSILLGTLNAGSPHDWNE